MSAQNITLLQRLDQAMLEIINLRSEKEVLKHHINKIQKYGFYKEPIKRFKSLEPCYDTKDADDLIDNFRKSKTTDLIKRLKITIVNSKHIENHVKDFEHLFALHKKNEYIKTMKRIEEVYQMNYIDEETVI